MLMVFQTIITSVAAQDLGSGFFFPVFKLSPFLNNAPLTNIFPPVDAFHMKQGSCQRVTSVLSLSGFLFSHDLKMFLKCPYCCHPKMFALGVVTSFLRHSLIFTNIVPLCIYKCLVFTFAIWSVCKYHILRILINFPAILLCQSVTSRLEILASLRAC